MRIKHIEAMKIFRKTTVENEQIKQQAEQGNGKVESIPVYKRRERKDVVQDKGKGLHTSKHREA